MAWAVGEGSARERVLRRSGIFLKQLFVIPKLPPSQSGHSQHECTTASLRDLSVLHCNAAIRSFGANVLPFSIPIDANKARSSEFDIAMSNYDPVASRLRSRPFQGAVQRGVRSQRESSGKVRTMAVRIPLERHAGAIAMKYRRDIDGLRALAVLPVVFYHAGVPGPSGGFVGVDVFFVISGYLITSLVTDDILRGRFSLVDFYERRARRILPALSVVVFATLAAGWCILLPPELKGLGQSAVATSLFLSNIYFELKLDYFSTEAEFLPLLHTWSLSVEEQFYMIFPPFLAFIIVRSGKSSAVKVLVVFSLFSLAAAIGILPIRPASVFYQIFFRAWELGVGALLALVAVHAPKQRRTREFVAFCALLAILIPVFVYGAETPFPGLAAVPPVLGAAGLILVGGSETGSAVSRFLSGRGIVWIGLISYSLYLWHWPILAFLRITLGTATLPFAVALAGIALSVVCAWASYRFVERPFRSLPPQGLRAGQIFLAAGSSIVATIAIGVVIQVSDGMPSRLPQQLLAVAAAKDDRNPRRAECYGNLPEDQLCSIGASSIEGQPIDFLLWGDSHADAFMPGIDLAAQAAGRHGVFAASSACVPVKYVQRQPDLQNCGAMNEAVWAFLNARGDIPLVILGARWTIAAEGSRYRGEPGKPVTLAWTGERDTRPDDTGNAALLEAGLDQTVAALRASGRQVVILGPVPEVGWDVPTVVARAGMLGLPYPKGPTVADFEARAGRTDALLARVAAAHDGVSYLPLSDAFCGSKACAVRNETGLPLYVDDDHITRSAAETLLIAPFSTIWSLDSGHRSVVAVRDFLNGSPEVRSTIDFGRRGQDALRANTYLFVD